MFLVNILLTVVALSLIILNEISLILVILPLVPTDTFRGNLTLM